MLENSIDNSQFHCIIELKSAICLHHLKDFAGFLHVFAYIVTYFLQKSTIFFWNG
jgi:hypothetical protein